MNGVKRSAEPGHAVGRYVHDVALVVLFSSIFSVLPLELNPQLGITSGFVFPFLVDWSLVGLANVLSLTVYAVAMVIQYHRERREAKFLRGGSVTFDPAEFSNDVRMG